LCDKFVSSTELTQLRESNKTLLELLIALAIAITIFGALSL
jgi:hypothetical protein